MSRTNLYYLVARNRANNDFQVIPVFGNRGCSLEEIDLYTTEFSSEEELAKALREASVVSYSDIDFFIANQKRVKGETYLKKQELLFSKSKKVQEIAQNSMNGKIEKSSNQIDRILDYFGEKMTTNSGFYSDVIAGRTNVYEKYARYFPFNRSRSLASMKYRDGGWARTSYPLVRNIVEATSREKRRYSRMSDQLHRDLLDTRLIRVTDPEYDENQLSMFDQIDEDMVDDSVLEVMSQFEKLPKDTFVLQDEETHFNPSTFSSYEEGDLEKFDTYLSPELKLCVRLFAAHRDYLEEFPINLAEPHQVPIQQGLKTMVKLLREDPEVLSRACLWCRLYEKYGEKTLGDRDERGFQKRKDS